MSQISPAEASDLLLKLFNERVRLATFFITPSGARVRLDGFLTGATWEQGIFITTHPLPEGGGDFINVFPFKEGECDFSYGEERELAEENRGLARGLGESVLIIAFHSTGERFSIFFTF
jgi:hypothetical protein